VDAEDQCSACGERNPAGTAFCLFCGVYLGWNEPGRGPASSSAGTPPAGTGTAPGSGAAAPVAPPTAPPDPVPSSPGAPCPHCGQPNPPDRRFCGRCGYPLVAAPVPTSRTPVPQTSERRGWWARWSNPDERRAKREYRRSLPPFYRWRRVLVTVGVVAAAALVLVVTGNNPVGYVHERWLDLTVDPVPIADVTATARPPGSVAPTYDVSKLPGERRDAWATDWPAGTTTLTGCGSTPNRTGRIVLGWDQPTRVRGLEVWAGVAAEKGRLNQFRPRRLDVTYLDHGAARCVELSLHDAADGQRLSFDTGSDVTSLLVSVGSVFPPTAQPSTTLVAIGGIQVLHRP
jgi:zinc-ribbon domain